MKKYAKKTVLLGAVGVCVIIMISGVLFVYQEKQWHSEKVEEFGTIIDLPMDTVVKKISKEDRIQNILLRAIREKREPFHVIVRKEGGLRAIVALVHQDMIPMLLRNLERAYPQRFPGYKKVSERKLEYGEKKAVEVAFTYTSPAGGTIKQRLVIMEYDGDTALYFSAQAQKQDFDRLNKKYFNRIFSSIRFQE